MFVSFANFSNSVKSAGDFNLTINWSVIPCSVLSAEYFTKGLATIMSLFLLRLLTIVFTSATLLPSATSMIAVLFGCSIFFFSSGLTKGIEAVICFF